MSARRLARGVFAIGVFGVALAWVALLALAMPRETP